jgi:hypothetical protein
VNGGQQYIQVDNYPAHAVSKTIDGLWRLENHFVIFNQVEPLSPDQVPLLDV